jgi:hypothetical protein
MKANLLGKFSVAVEQTLIILSGPRGRATEIDKRALRYRCPALQLAGYQDFSDWLPGIHKIIFLRFAPNSGVRELGQASIFPSN